MMDYELTGDFPAADMITDAVARVCVDCVNSYPNGSRCHVGFGMHEPV
jgi:hypothetical protein